MNYNILLKPSEGEKKETILIQQYAEIDGCTLGWSDFSKCKKEKNGLYGIDSGPSPDLPLYFRA